MTSTSRLIGFGLLLLHAACAASSSDEASETGSAVGEDRFSKEFPKPGPPTDLTTNKFECQGKTADGNLANFTVETSCEPREDHPYSITICETVLTLDGSPGEQHCTGQRGLDTNRYNSQYGYSVATHYRDIRGGSNPVWAERLLFNYSLDPAMMRGTHGTLGTFAERISLDPNTNEPKRDSEGREIHAGSDRHAAASCMAVGVVAAKSCMTQQKERQQPRRR
jgi:hypothetical protein